MAWHSILYNALLVTCVPYALLRGGAPERWCAAVALLATILSILALSRSASVYQDAEVGTLIVDGLALAAFFGVALFADRFWPLLVAGLQADAVIIHICKLMRPDILPLGYAIGLSIWSYPILMVLAIGTARHQRRLATYGRDPAWSAGGRPVAANGFGGAVSADRSPNVMRRSSTGGMR
jgi:hypothetical protein